MDTENMHPFCLPFGFCHDATSSNITADFTHTNNNETDSLSNDIISSIKDRIRSKTSSPSDDLFRHLNNSTLSVPSQSSLLNDDLIIGSSSSLDINGEESFYSLELDIDTSHQDTDVEFISSDEDLKGNNEDWYSSQYSLFSPTRNQAARRRSLRVNSQVFHHAVDPIDIKSSPTLAQLNLNSTDDQNEGLWDTQTSATNSDLLSNCTSIHGPNGTSSHNNNVICNHLHHHHHALHNHHNLPYYSNLSNIQSSSCHHVHHHHLGRFASGNSTQSTCLAVTPFRKSDYQSTCCHSLLTTAANPDNGPNLKLSSTLNQLNQINPSNDSLPATGRQLSNVESNKICQQRSASPALVTSSSSPLSSSLSNSSCENRQVDNKLKENIEYLTALLCNGNKLDNNNQQPTISSTMVKSYTTLAHSLSTEPKLLERQQQPLATYNAQQKLYNHQLVNSQQPNEASPTLEATQQNFVQFNSLKRPHTPVESWIEVSVESSVSAADSTQSQVVDRLANNEAPQRTDLNVLSSLLTSSKCTTNSSSNNQTVNCTGWTGRSHCLQPHPNNAQQPHVEQALSTQAVQQTNSSIPLNGKPIILTPISSNNNLILQPQDKRPRGALFAQPASPSASSTASSGNTADSYSTNNSMQPKKKRNPQQKSLNEKPDRNAQNNSMTTDCSVSSHDEGFSSQVDNDDCGSTRDSDDDDDVDSDDESFYGDYTNSDLIGASISDNAENKWTLNMGRTRRNGQKRYFWQYNVQSKGPKGARICSTDDCEDPFILPEASDPVFSNDCQIEGVKHSGKARRGDGNDLTPNPRKLLMIGLELKKLGKIINDLAPVTDLPVNARNKTRKEKNKLASRACRLKKKAQHEANKIKLYGLQREHQQVVLAIYKIKKLLNATLLEREGRTPEQINQAQQNVAEKDLGGKSSNNGNVKSTVETIAEQCSMRVAGQTSDYVNSVLEKVVSGCIDGGLQT